MPAQQQHWISSAYLSATTDDIAVGSVMVLDEDGDYYVVATAANRAAAVRSTACAGVAVTAGDSTNRHVEIQTVGPCPQSITGLGAGTASDLRVSSTGTLERATIASGDVYAGKCDADGFAYLNFGGGASGGGATPGGGVFGEDLAHFWGGRYNDSTGTWIDEAGDDDADDSSFTIPTEDTINGHTYPTFDGVGDALVTPAAITTLDSLSSYCIFACFNAGTNAFGSVLEQALQFGIQFSLNKVIAFVNDGSGGDYMQGASTINDSRWHRVIVNVDAGAASLYIDGVLEDTSTFSAISASALNVLRFGVSGSGVHYQGGITACGIATRAATIEEVLLLDAGLANWVGGGDATSFRGVPLANETPEVGSSWVYDGTNYVLKKPAPEGWQDVRDYGAVGTDTNVWDTVTDHTAFLQAALDAPSKGGRCHIPSGNYFITSELQVPDHATEISGAGSPYNLDHSVVIHAVASMRSILRVTGRTQIRNLVLDCLGNANYGITRHGDSGSRYENVLIFSPLYDGFHTVTVRDGYTYSAVSLTGTSPLITVAADPDPNFGGAFTLDITSPTEFTVTHSLGTVGPFTIPTSGSREVSIPITTSGYAIGTTVTFPVGVYVGGDSYDWTVTATATINDGTSFVQCYVTKAGRVYCTNNFNGGIRPSSELTLREITAIAASGTVDITAGSELIVGSGTSFRSTGARPGDFIRIGAYPEWEASTAYIIGDMVIPDGRGPGQAFVWRCVSAGTSDSSQPTWPLDTTNVPGSMPIHSGAGMQVTDGGTTWECWNPVVFQIVNVLDDTTIVVNEDLTPRKTLSGLDYAVHRGAGWFEEISTDANTSVLDNCIAVHCAGAGVISTANYGNKYVAGEYFENGVCGISTGGFAGRLQWNTVGLGTYMEGNICANWIVGTCLGIDLIRVELSGNVSMPVLDLGSVSTFGVLNSSRDGTEQSVSIPIGTGAWSTVPARYTSGSHPFNVQGPLVYVPDGIVPALSDTIDPSNPIVQINASGTFTSNPTIAAGEVVGQVVELFNYGTTSWALDATKGMTLEKEIVVVESTNSIRFFWDGFTWRQLGAVGRGANRAFTWSLSTGANEDIDNPGGEKVNVTGVGGAFEIGSIDAGRDGQILDIINLTTQNMTIKNESAGTASGRIKTGTGGDVVITGSSGFSSARLMYVTASTRWILLGKNP